MIIAIQFEKELLLFDYSLSEIKNTITLSVDKNESYFGSFCFLPLQGVVNCNTQRRH